MSKKFISIFLSLCLTVSSVAVGSFAVSAATAEGEVAASVETESAGSGNYGLQDNIQDGTILHCFDWKLSDIKAELPNIAAAGFTAVQTSPLTPTPPAGAWYWAYLPTSFSIGSTVFGDKSGLQDLCNTADQYGIKVIVDVVSNHMTGSRDEITQTQLRDNQYWHTYGGVTNWADRYQVTHGEIGMADLKTEDSYVQSCVRAYVDELKSVGVDGCRWDAAKHIGVPSEEDGFWPAVTGNTGMYHYGEILVGPDDRASGNESIMVEYTNYMSVTDSSYGYELRNAFNSGYPYGSYGNWAARGVAANKLVYWGESHDTWSNGTDWGYSWGISQNNIDRAYAVAGSRYGATALYFSRPSSNQKEGILMGQKGSTHFTAPEVAAVNHFHNALVGQTEYYTTGSNCAVICRKDGAVVVAGSGSNFQVTVPNGGGTTTAGTYTDEITGNTWTVTGSTMSGQIGSSGIAVIYNATTHPSASATPGTSNYTTDTLNITLNLKNAISGQYSIDGGAYQSFTNGQTITIGSGKAYNTETTVSVKATDGTETSDPVTYTYTKKNPADVQKVYFDNSSYNWSAVYAYIYKTSGTTTTSNADWPGQAMSVDSSTGYYALEVPSGYENGKIIFTESATATTNRYPADSEPGLDLGGNTMIMKANHVFETYNPVPVPTTTKTPVSTTTAPIPTTTAPIGSVLIGDTNKDGRITISDATEIQLYLVERASFDETQLVAADVNKDNVVSVKDVTCIQYYLVQLSANAGSCGQYTGGDPTPTTTQPVTTTQPITNPPADTVILNASAAAQGNEKWYAWTWGSDNVGNWVEGTGSASSVSFTGLKANVLFARVDATKTAAWDNGSVWNQTADLTTQLGGTYTLNADFTGSWSGGTIIQPTTVTGDTVTLNASATCTGTEDWYAWTWNTTSDGRWVKGSGSASAVTFSGLSANVLFVRADPSKTIGWDNNSVWNQTNDLVTQVGHTYTTTGWSDSIMNGSWN